MLNGSHLEYECVHSDDAAQAAYCVLAWLPAERKGAVRAALYATMQRMLSATEQLLAYCPGICWKGGISKKGTEVTR